MQSCHVVAVSKMVLAQLSDDPHGQQRGTRFPDGQMAHVQLGARGYELRQRRAGVQTQHASIVFGRDGCQPFCDRGRLTGDRQRTRHSLLEPCKDDVHGSRATTDVEIRQIPQGVRGGRQDQERTQARLVCRIRATSLACPRLEEDVVHHQALVPQHRNDVRNSQQPLEEQWRDAGLEQSRAAQAERGQRPERRTARQPDEPTERRVALQPFSQQARIRCR